MKLKKTSTGEIATLDDPALTFGSTAADAEGPCDGTSSRREPCGGNLRKRFRRAICCLVLGVFALTSSKAQAYPLINSPGLEAGVITVLVVIGIGVPATILYLVDRGKAEGCIAESGGKKTFTGPDKKVYTLLDSGLALPVGSRVKLKGHKAGPKSARTFQVEKVIKVYGPCQP